MKPFEHNELNNFIAGWHIDINLCDDIFFKSENNIDAFQIGIKEYTNCDLFQLDQDLHNRYCGQLHNVIEKYKSLYPFCYEEINVWGWSPPRIQRYEPNKFYKDPHCENTGHTLYLRRHLAYMTYLNDINDGGGTEFLHQNLSVKPSKGLTLIWPATWTHYHRGIVAPTEIKYIITGWLCFYPDNYTE